jgi:aspartokinase/homoserine dehydrogenase 1
VPERNISAVINEDKKKALNSLHENFFEKHQAIESLCDGREMWERNLSNRYTNKRNFKRHLRIKRVIALSNSRKMYFDEDGFH